MHPGIELILGPNLSTQKSTDADRPQHIDLKGAFYNQLSQASSKLNALAKGAELNSKKISDQSRSLASTESDPNSPQETHQVESTGQEVPPLMAHEKSNDIGRLILTTEQPKVSPASLRDFISAQYVSSKGNEGPPTTKNPTNSINPLVEPPNAVRQNIQVLVAPDRATQSKSLPPSIRNDPSAPSKAAAAQSSVESSVHSVGKAIPSSPTLKDVPSTNLRFGLEKKPSPIVPTNAIDGIQRRESQVEAGTAKEQAVQASTRSQGETRSLVPVVQHGTTTESTLQKRVEEAGTAKEPAVQASTRSQGETRSLVPVVQHGTTTESTLQKRVEEAGTAKEPAVQASTRSQGETRSPVPIVQHGTTTESILQKRVETVTIDGRNEVKIQDKSIELVAPDKRDNANPTFSRGSNAGGHSGNQLSNLAGPIDVNAFLGEDQGNFDEALTEARSVSRSSIELARSATSNTNTSATYQGLIQKLGEAVANRLSAAIGQENWNFHIRVRPAELGTIDVSIEYRDNGLEARVTADEASTRVLLQDSLAKLRMSLKETLDSSQNVDVYIGQDSKNQEEQHRDEERTNPGSVDVDLTMEIDLIHQKLTHQKASSDRIDLMV